MFTRPSPPGPVLALAAALLLAPRTSAQQPPGPAAPAPPAPAPAPAPALAPAATYWVYVGAESADLLHRVRFGPEGASVEHTVHVGELPNETEGPHGLRVSPDGRYLYMTTGHGLPTGKLWKIELGPDTVVGEPIFLGRFPATLDVTPDGLFAFVVNFDLHGAHVPSTVSTVFTPELIEVAQTVTCTMPHGARVDPGGRRIYSACMMDDRLVEMDTRAFEVSRQFHLSKGDEGPLTEAMAEHAGHVMAPPSCSPTWAQPSVDGAHVYVTCNASDEILEIAVEEWRLARRWETGRGPYNLAVTPDGGLLVVTLKQGAGVEVIDLRTGQSRGRVATSAPVTHGVVVSPDGRYAFVSVENIGMAPGKVDVYDLRTLALAASVEVGQQASGIDFWKMEPPPPAR